MSFISKQIEDLLKIEKSNNDLNFIQKDFTIKWDVIQNLFDVNENLDDPSTCLKLKRQLDPIISHSHGILITSQRELVESLERYLTWTFASNEIACIFYQFCENFKKYALTGFLQITAIIEFSLGNVYHTYTKHQPPHLLKDLLKELRTCTFFEEIQILLGTSKGVNLRNVSWHGFIHTIDPEYLSFLFIMMISYGKQLQSFNIKSKVRKTFEFTIDINPYIEKIDKILLSPTIEVCNYEAWKAILEFYREKEFRNGIFLLLSQIESLLRFIYGRVNNLNVIAELSKYYVIMDSIFYGYILSTDMTPLVIGKITKNQELEIRKTHQRNKLLDLLPRSIYHMHYDLFYALEGPRLRDKISHGEMAVNHENLEKICLTLLMFTVMTVEYYDYNCLPDAWKYESLYVGNLIFFRQLKEVYKLIDDFLKEIEIPETLKGNEDVIKFEQISLDVKADQIKIHFRPMIETHVIKMMIKILDNLKYSIINFKESSKDLFQLYNERKLSSSRRNMLTNLISFIPNFSLGFNKILEILLNIFLMIQELDDKFDNEIWSKKIMKVLKKIHQLTQIYQKHFSIDDRNYFVAHTKTLEFLEHLILDKVQFTSRNIQNP